MNDEIATHTAYREYYVVKIDGHANSGHTHYIDALRAGLNLKYQLPDRDIKVCAAEGSTKILPGTVSH